MTSRDAGNSSWKQDLPEPSALGKINLVFEPVVNNATVSGIEILDESK
jgi:hypothetical protein